MTGDKQAEVQRQLDALAEEERMLLHHDASVRADSGNKAEVASRSMRARRLAEIRREREQLVAPAQPAPVPVHVSLIAPPIAGLSGCTAIVSVANPSGAPVSIASLAVIAPPNSPIATPAPRAFSPPEEIEPAGSWRYPVRLAFLGHGTFKLTAVVGFADGSTVSAEGTVTVVYPA